MFAKGASQPISRESRFKNATLVFYRIAAGKPQIMAKKKERPTPCGQIRKEPGTGLLSCASRAGKDRVAG